MRKKVWINLDPTVVDVSYLDKRLREGGFDIIYKVIHAEDEKGTIELANKVDAVISVFEQWNERTLPAVGNKLRLIQRYGAGIDNINIKVATEVGIPIANVPGANSAAVAEIALLHILNLGRRFYSCIEDCIKGIWPCTITGNELDKKTVGLLGFGNIARHLVRMMSGFDVNVIVYDPYIKPELDGYYLEAVNSMEELFSRSDIVSLHIPLNEETRGIVNKKLINLMKPTAYLVNTCRGAIINEQDLIEALQEAKIRGAGLDVLSIEPPDVNNALFSMDNVFITSHMGAESAESGYRSQKIMAETLETFFAGKMPYNVKNKEVGRK